MKEKQILDRWKELPYLYKVQILSYFIAGLCNSIAYPLTTKLVYSSVDTNILASRLVISSTVGLILSLLWLTIQERLYKYFIHFTIIEFFSYLFVILYVVFYQDFNAFLILNALISGTIGYIVGGAGSKLHQQITDVEQYRTDYGFFIQIISCLGVLAGSAIAVTLNVTMPVAFTLLLIGLIGFQMTDIYVYQQVRKLQENK